MADGRLWEQQARPRKKFKETSEVRDPEVVVDTRPDDEPVKAPVDPIAVSLDLDDVPKPPAMREAKIPENIEREKLEDAAKMLLRYLPDETQVLITEASQQMNLPIWQLLLGYTMRARERDEVFFPVVLSMWEYMLPANAARPCAKCGSQFTPKFGEGRYCCEPCFFEKLSTRGHAEDCPTRKTVMA